MERVRENAAIGGPKKLSEQNTAATVALARAAGRGRRCHRRKVRVHPDVGQVVAQPADASPRDQLTIVELYPLQVVTVDEMVEGLVGDEGTVVQLQHGQGLAGTRRGAKVTDS